MIVNKITYKKLIGHKAILVALISSFLMSCNGHESDSITSEHDELQVDLNPPTLVTQSLNGNTLLAEATLSLDGKRNAYPLTVNKDNSVSGIISNIEPGIYHLYLEFYIMYPGARLPLASYSNDGVTVGAGLQSPVHVDKYNVAFDEDSDNYTNLAEVRLGSNPFDSGSVPKPNATSSLAIASYGKATSATGKSLTHRIGESIVGDGGNTSNFHLQAGFDN